MGWLRMAEEAATQLLFPHHCAGCGTDLLSRETEICWHCLGSLPETRFASIAANPVEKIFWGRMPVEAAAASFFYTHGSVLQTLMQSFKYHSNQLLGKQLGRLLGQSLLEGGRFQADALIPVPLHPLKERRRGFNQAAVLCHGMAELLKIPVIEGALIRKQATETQTRKGRLGRWANTEGKFAVSQPAAIQGLHCLLVDDVITTGATLESCGGTLLQVPDTRLSIAALCIASQV